MNVFPKIKLAVATLIVAALSRPDPLFACAACYGQSDSPLAQALNWGIFAMLGVLLCVLSGVTLFFVHIGRRTATARAQESGELPNTKP